MTQDRPAAERARPRRVSSSSSIENVLDALETAGAHHTASLDTPRDDGEERVGHARGCVRRARRSGSSSSTRRSRSPPLPSICRPASAACSMLRFVQDLTQTQIADADRRLADAGFADPAPRARAAARADASGEAGAARRADSGRRGRLAAAAAAALAASASCPERVAAGRPRVGAAAQRPSRRRDCVDSIREPRAGAADARHRSTYPGCASVRSARTA